jgi:flavin reductase (DIM6/NTAB) family NADH-FMN oxidoreductase RutF
MNETLQEITWDEAIELGSPYPYVLAVTVDADNKANIIGLGWWTIVSWDPKMIAISIGKNRYSHECLAFCKEFVLCFPSYIVKEGAWLCGIKSGRDTDKFFEAGFTPIPSKMVKPPTIKESTVAYECKVVNLLDVGDHTLFIGKVMATRGSQENSLHLYSVHYKKLIGLDFKGNLKMS